jgi:hypothetical protein
MEHLQQKHLDGHDRIEESVAPRSIADRITRGLDGIGLQLGGPLDGETLQRLGQFGNHAGGSWCWALSLQEGQSGVVCLLSYTYHYCSIIEKQEASILSIGALNDGRAATCPHH